MIKITKDNLYYLEFIGDKEKEVRIDELPMYLSEEIDIEEGVTFSTIFDLLIANREIFNIIFYSVTSGFNIDLYIDDYISDPKDNKPETQITYLEVNRNFEHNIFDGSDEWEYYYSLHGISTDEDIAYSIALSPLNEIKSIPIKVNKELNIVTDTGIELSETTIFSDKFKSIHVAQIPITLFNFLGAILNEITFHGTSENKVEFSNELNDRVEKIKTGEEKTYELLKDENGEYYFLDSDGNKKYLLDRGDDEDDE